MITTRTSHNFTLLYYKFVTVFRVCSRNRYTYTKKYAKRCFFFIFITFLHIENPKHCTLIFYEMCLRLITFSCVTTTSRYLLENYFQSITRKNNSITSIQQNIIFNRFIYSISNYYMYFSHFAFARWLGQVTYGQVTRTYVKKQKYLYINIKNCSFDILPRFDLRTKCGC